LAVLSYPPRCERDLASSLISSAPFDTHRVVRMRFFELEKGPISFPPFSPSPPSQKISLRFYHARSRLKNICSLRRRFYVSFTCTAQFFSSVLSKGQSPSGHSDIVNRPDRFPPPPALVHSDSIDKLLAPVAEMPPLCFLGPPTAGCSFSPQVPPILFPLLFFFPFF